MNPIINKAILISGVILMIVTGCEKAVAPTSHEGTLAKVNESLVKEGVLAQECPPGMISYWRFDDGSTNQIKPGVALESSKFFTMTNEPAFLKRPPGKSLSSIRVVPNPYNIGAREIQFGIGDTKDKLLFVNLPPVCRIKIFTERGDLVNTIEHTDGSGDEAWDSITSSRQIVVSGLYIAYIEVLEDKIDEETGEQLFKKGQSTYVKFVIIR